MISDTIDGVLIEGDEDGFHLILSGHEEEYNFRVQGVAVELLRAVQSEIGSWWAEGQAARRQFESARAYEPDDPKSEDYHDRMTALWDQRPGK